MAAMTDDERFQAFQKQQAKKARRLLDYTNTPRAKAERQKTEDEAAWLVASGWGYYLHDPDYIPAPVEISD